MRAGPSRLSHHACGTTAPDGHQHSRKRIRGCSCAPCGGSGDDQNECKRHAWDPGGRNVLEAHHGKPSRRDAAARVVKGTVTRYTFVARSQATATGLQGFIACTAWQARRSASRQVYRAALGGGKAQGVWPTRGC